MMKPTWPEVANAAAWAAPILAVVILLNADAQVWILLAVNSIAASISMLVLRRVQRSAI